MECPNCNYDKSIIVFAMVKSQNFVWLLALVIVLMQICMVQIGLLNAYVPNAKQNFHSQMEITKITYFCYKNGEYKNATI